MVIRARAPLGLALLATVLVACAPELDARASRVETTRVLAVRSEPAEAAAGAAISYRALVADPSGTLAGAAIDWAFCTLPRPVAEANDVAIACFRRSADWILPLGVGEAVAGKLPLNGCRQFGPDVPEGKPGEPAGRPTDPDATGGFYQPVRLILGDSDADYVLALGQTRLVCGLPGATREVLEDFRARYRTNENPTLASVEVVHGGAADALTGSDASAPTRLAPGERVLLRATWPTCPVTATCGDAVCSPDESAASCADDCTAPRGCEGAESYVAYDVATRSVGPRREAMRVSWLSSAGAFDDDRSGRAGDDLATSVEVAFTAPEAPGRVPVWVVLRDERGGVDARAFAIEVR